MRVDVLRAAPDTLVLEWSDARPGTVPAVYIDHVARPDAVHGRLITLDGLRPEEYTLSVTDAAVHLTRAPLAAQPLSPRMDATLAQEREALDHALARHAELAQRQRAAIDHHNAQRHTLEDTAHAHRAAADALRTRTATLEAEAHAAADALRTLTEHIADAEQRARHETHALTQTLRRQEHAAHGAAHDVERLQRERDALHAEIRQERARLPWDAWTVHRRTSSYPGPARAPTDAWAALRRTESPPFQFPVAPREESMSPLQRLRATT